MKQCLDVLAKCAGGDGNLLFNVGPMPNGQIENRQVSRLAEIGAWIEKYGETIYGTRGGPFMPTAWGVSTSRGNTVYVHILDWKAAPDKLLLPVLNAKVTEGSLLTGGSLKWKQTRKGIRLEIPATARDALDTIVVLKLDAAAADITPVALASETALKFASVKASNVHQGDAAYGPDKAFDGLPSTRWATDGGTHQAWIEVAFKRPTKVGRVHIQEACGERVQEFVLEYESGETWMPFHKGTTIGENFKGSFSPVKAKEFRLNILNATEGPTLWEIQFLPPES
jgi:alpha-L-fucosidase